MSASGHYDSSFFDDAFTSNSATPPANPNPNTNNYLDSVLNPQPQQSESDQDRDGIQEGNRRVFDDVFGYPVPLYPPSPDTTFQQQQYPPATIIFGPGGSPFLSFVSRNNSHDNNTNHNNNTTMAPSHRASGRPSRLPNGFSNLVDLTAESPEDSRRRTRRERESSTPAPGPSHKRQKQNDGTSLNVSDAEIESIDLATTNNQTSMHDVLRKQREEAVKLQKKPEETTTTFNNFTCVICMDTPTDLTATACGHLFCHTCLMEALIAGENRSAPGDPRRSQCPVCRKVISRTKASDIIPLLLKKGLATQPRKKATPKVT